MNARNARLVRPPLNETAAAKKRLGNCVICRHKNTQEAKQVGILGAEWRAPPRTRNSLAVSSLLSRTAQHKELPDAKI